MLKAIITCLILCLFDVSCSFFSVTVSNHPILRSNFQNQPFGAYMEAYCDNQRESFNISSGGSCELDRWFYDARSMELTCVCVENGSTKANGKLLQGLNDSTAIPAISQANFREAQDLYQGQYRFELKILATSNPNETVQNLFADVASRDDAVVHTKCYPIPHRSDSYRCSTVYSNKYNVAWEFPENWSGPVRFLKHIALGSDKINFEIDGLYWSTRLPNNIEELYVDVVLLVEESSTDVCMKFFKKLTKKCNPEFLEKAALNGTYFVARVNLLMPVERNTTWRPEVEALLLARRLDSHEHSCGFPVQIRQGIATYVPSEAAAQGEYFEFRVTFAKAILGQSVQTEPDPKRYCLIIMYLAPELIRKCRVFDLLLDHGIADVSVPRTNASFWEIQLQLMITLNSQSRDICKFNVEAKTVRKSY